MSNYQYLKNTNIAQATVLSDSFLQVQEGDGKIVFKQGDFFAMTDKKQIVQVSPTTQVPSNLSNAQVDFKIENVIDQIEYITLQWTYVNNTGANASVVAAPLHIQRIDVTPNGNGVLFQTYDQEMYMQYFYLDRNTYEAQASAIGLTTAYTDSAVVVPPLGTLTLNLPLYGFWKAIKIAPYCLTVPLLLRLYFNSSNLIVLTGSTMTCQDLKMIIRGKTLKNGPRNDLMKIYKDAKIPMSLAHLAVDRQSNTQLLGPNQQVKYVLTGITGICAFLLFTVRLAANANSAAGQCTYIRMTNFDVLDAQGASAIGYYLRDVQTQQIDYSANYGNQAWLSKEFQIVSWANNPRGSFATGQNSGYFIFTGNEYLQFTTPPGLAIDSYIIDVRGYMHENLIGDMGSFKTTRL